MVETLSSCKRLFKLNKVKRNNDLITNNKKMKWNKIITENTHDTQNTQEKIYKFSQNIFLFTDLFIILLSFLFEFVLLNIFFISFYFMRFQNERKKERKKIPRV